MNKHKIDGVLSLESKDRYGYLIRKVADFERIFLITDESNSFVTLGTERIRCIPVWPELEFAEQFLIDDWQGYKIKDIDLDDFLEWLDQLESENYYIAAFPNKNLKSVIVRPIEIKNHLLAEIEQYE